MHVEKITAKMRKEYQSLRECSWNRKGESPCFERAVVVIHGDPYCEEHLKKIGTLTKEEGKP